MIWPAASARWTATTAGGRPRYWSKVRDASGREMEFRGEVLSRLALPTTPYFVWLSIVRWTFPDGSVGYGRDHETWSPLQLRHFLSPPGTGRPRRLTHRMPCLNTGIVHVQPI